MGEYWDQEFDTMPWQELHGYWLEKMRTLVNLREREVGFLQEPSERMCIDIVI